jgi:hypothetical protein
MVMELSKFGALSTTACGLHQVHDWFGRLTSACGNFRITPYEGARAVTGVVNPIAAGGMEFVQVANDLATITRGHRDIRQDYGEHLFLLLQIEGECGIEQCGRQTAISPGDCVLVDSSTPSSFHFGGRFSNHLSVHLPRQLLFSHKSARVEVARRIGAEDPMSSVLRGIVAKLMKAPPSGSHPSELRQLLFDATRQAFSADDERLPIRGDCASHRIEIVQILIDRHLTEPTFVNRHWTGTPDRHPKGPPLRGGVYW